RMFGLLRSTNEVTPFSTLGADTYWLVASGLNIISQVSLNCTIGLSLLKGTLLVRNPALIILASFHQIFMYSGPDPLHSPEVLQLLIKNSSRGLRLCSLGHST